MLYNTFNILSLIQHCYIFKLLLILQKIKTDNKKSTVPNAGILLYVNIILEINSYFWIETQTLVHIFFILRMYHIKFDYLKL